MNCAIHVDHLSKQYRVRRAEHADSLRDVIVDGVRRLLSGGKASRDRSTFWALRNVSFEVGQGEIVGVIGRNGAGKSTLLKILSRITPPTTGRAVTRGQLGSLLEVGTGFHPELSGRENIYLNGAIIGMSRADIRHRLDSIVEFSGVSAFIDTPVKRYSSGMRVRLAFAVAAHLEPDVLIVDEVLAVGDAEFQAKCLGKMNDVAHGGQTVLFVSHNMNAVLNLCGRAIVLEDGIVGFDGTAADAVRTYTQTFSAPASDGLASFDASSQRAPGMHPIVMAVGMRRYGSRDYLRHANVGDDLVFDVHYDCGESAVDVVQLMFSTIGGEPLFTLGTHLSESAPPSVHGRGVIECRLRHLPLTAGDYDVSVLMTNRIPWHEVDRIDGALRFQVETNNYFGTGLQPGTEQGPFALRSTWSEAAI